MWKSAKKESTINKIQRRRFLWLMGGVLSFQVLPIRMINRLASAMAEKDYPQGMREIDGPVQINGKPARKGDLVKPGDVVTTGEGGHAVFVVGQSAFMIRDNSRIHIDTEEGAVFAMGVVKGKILSVFAKGFKKITTPTAICGIRGSAMYVEAAEDQTYICLCYGEASISPTSDSSLSKKLKAHHHEYAYFIHGKGDKEFFEKAPMKNHSDEELIMLEKQVGRVPPFYGEKVGYDSY